MRGVILSFFVCLFDTVIPFNSFYSVPVFSEERINGSFYFLVLSLFTFFNRWIRNAGASGTQQVGFLTDFYYKKGRGRVVHTRGGQGNYAKIRMKVIKST